MLFPASVFLAPVISIIPAAAASSALIYVGILMLSVLKGIDFDDLSETAPVFVMLIAMPISGFIGHGIGLAFITYTFIRFFAGEWREVPIPTYILSVLFLIKFFVVI